MSYIFNQELIDELEITAKKEVELHVSELRCSNLPSHKIKKEMTKIYEVYEKSMSHLKIHLQVAEIVSTLFSIMEEKEIMPLIDFEDGLVMSFTIDDENDFKLEEHINFYLINAPKLELDILDDLNFNVREAGSHDRLTIGGNYG